MSMVYIKIYDRMSFWWMEMIVRGTIIVHDSLVNVANRPLRSCQWNTYIRMTIAGT